MTNPTVILVVLLLMENIGLAVESSGQYNKALDLFKNKHYKEAIVAGEQYIASNPAHNLNLSIYGIIGESYFKLGNYKKAEAIGKLLLDDYPNAKQTQEFYASMGYWYGKIGEYKKAIEYNGVLLNNYPGSEMVPKVILGSAAYYAYLRDYEKALQLNREFLEKYPGSDVSEINTANTNIALIYDQLRKGRRTFAGFLKYREIENPYYRIINIFSTILIQSIMTAIALLLSIIYIRKYIKAKKAYDLLYSLCYIFVLIVAIESIVLIKSSMFASSIINRIIGISGIVFVIAATAMVVKAIQLRRREKRHR